MGLKQVVQSDERTLLRRTILVVGSVLGLAVLAILVVVVVQLLRDDDANLATQAPLIPVATASDVADEPTTAAGSTAIVLDLPDGVLHFVIDPSQSTAKYVVREKLAALPISSDAVGETSDVTGDIFISTEGLFDDQASTFKADLRTLKSDEAFRDRYLRNNTLQTARFPFAEFVVDRLIGFPLDYQEGTEVVLTLEGHLTIRDVTNAVVFEVRARRLGNILTAIADTDFNMSDFGITPPSVRLAVSEDRVHLQIELIGNLVN